MVRNYAGFEAQVFFIAETTEGETPSNPTYLNLAQKAEVTLSSQAVPVVVAKSGSVDNADIGKGVAAPVATLQFSPSQASGAAFLKTYASSDTSFTLLLMIDEGIDIVFGRIAGCKIKRISGTGQIYPDAKEFSCTAEIWGMEMLFTSALGGGSLESVPSSIVNWTNLIVKKDTITITDWWDFEFTVENDLFRMPTNTGTLSAIERGRRSVKGAWTRSSNATSGTGSTELAEQVAGTNVDLQLSVVADTYDFVDCVYEEVSVNHPLTAMVGIKQSFVAESLSIA